MSAFSLCFCILASFFTHTKVHTYTRVHTHSLPLDQSSPGSLWMHQSVYASVLGSVFSSSPVKSQCLSEVECNQNSVSSCFIQRHLLWAVFWFTAALHSTRSVQRGNKHPAVPTKESSAALGLWHLPPSHQQGGEGRVGLLSDVLLGILIQGQKQPWVVLMESTQKVQMRSIGVH